MENSFKPFQSTGLAHYKPFYGILRCFRNSCNANKFLKQIHYRETAIGQDIRAFTTGPAATETTNIKEKTKKPKSNSLQSTYWPCKDGKLVRVVQQCNSEQGIYVVQVLIEGLEPGQQADLLWGIYRSSPHAWQTPQEITPPDSQLDQTSGSMKSPMHPHTSTSQIISFTIPESMAPVTFAFVISITDTHAVSKKTRFASPIHGHHFSALVGFQPGHPTPLGPSLLSTPSSQKKKSSSSPSSSATDTHTVNFAVQSRGGTDLSLVILKPPPSSSQSSDTQRWSIVEIALDPVLNRTGDTWHVAVPNLKDIQSLCYGYRVDGEVSWESGYRIQPEKILSDPYASSLVYYPMPQQIKGDSVPALPIIEIHQDLNRNQHSQSSGASTQTTERVMVATSMASALAAQNAMLVDGVSMPLHTSLEKLRVLEVDVRGFAVGSTVQHPGTFLGVTERVDYIKALGANCVLLMPCCASDARGRAISFFSPDPSLSTNPTDPSAAARELRGMVHALHAAGIEVMTAFDVTFTADGVDAHSTAVSLRGLDHAAYYRLNGVLNCGHPAVHSLLTGAMRHWVLHYGMDGICFFNAENMTQDADSLVVDGPPLADMLCHDPLLSHTKLIAAPSDESLLPRGGARGFPHWALWLQRNGAFHRDFVSYFAESTPGMLDVIAMRLTGSADVFGSRWEEGLPGNLAAERRPAFGLNAVSLARHGPRGGSMQSSPLMSLAKEAAGMVGSAGTASGSGRDFPSAMTMAKSLLLTAIISQGIPAISYEDITDVEIARFVGVAMRLRRKVSSLVLQPLFDSPRDIQWRGADGGEPDWSGEGSISGSNMRGSNFLSYVVMATPAEEGDGVMGVYVGLNPHHHAVSATLPALPSWLVWSRVVDTSLPAPEDAVLVREGVEVNGGRYVVGGKGSVVLVAVKS